MRFNSAPVRYLLVGGVNTAFGYSMFALLIYLGLHYAIAAFLSTIAGILFNFKTFGRFVFYQSNWRLIGRFIVVYGVLYVINVGALFCLMRYMDNIYVASLITLILTAGLGFLLNRNFVYANN